MSEAESTDPHLDTATRERMRVALGRPARQRVASAIEEIERQVATEDVVLLLIDCASGAAMAFLDSVVSLVPDPAPPRTGPKGGPR